MFVTEPTGDAHGPHQYTYFFFLCIYIYIYMAWVSPAECICVFFHLFRWPAGNAQQRSVLKSLIFEAVDAPTPQLLIPTYPPQTTWGA